MKGRRTLFIALTVSLMIVSTAVVAVAHSSSKQTVIGAPNSVGMDAHPDGDVRWILPGPRGLDPAVFGTPGEERGLDLLPLTKRAATDDGYFVSGDGETPMMTPFSNKWAPITGEAKVKVTDVTAVSQSSTQDQINAEFKFTSPDGKNSYRLVVKKALPEVDHENFGGVGVNVLQHGATGIGTPLMPQLMAFIAFWGAGDLYVNGQLQKQKRFVHFMLSERVRSSDDAGYELAFNADVDPEGSLQAHLILPPVALNEDGPVPDSPVPTAFTLPNGNDQPFLHIMYDTVRVQN
ncbi:MAG: hypothetical protein BMS9Abin20_0320 [Acidimicrobiia bacterium]|nr:MAG: hypothetical protein BMS9Abin20_0320 [Acidimicrobiia bacterium]